MSDKQKQSAAIVIGLSLIVTYFLKGQFIDKPILQKSMIKDSLSQIDEKQTNLQGLRVRAQTEETSFSESEGSIKQLATRFPKETDEAKVFNVISKVIGDFPDVNITKRSPITKENFTFRAKFPEEDIKTTYQSVLLPGESGQPLQGETVVSNGLKIVRFDAHMEMTGDFQSLLKMLARLYAQPYYFEITDLDISALGTGKTAVQGEFTVSTLAFAGPVTKDHN